MLFTANTVTGTCPDGFSAGWYGVGKCYLIIRDKMAAFSAQLRCRDYKAKLVSIGSKSENDYLATTIYNQGRKFPFMIANFCSGKLFKYTVVCCISSCFDISTCEDGQCSIRFPASAVTPSFSIDAHFSRISFYFTVYVVILFLPFLCGPLPSCLLIILRFCCLFFAVLQPHLGLSISPSFPDSSWPDVLPTSSSPYYVCKRNTLKACIRVEYSLREINDMMTNFFCKLAQSSANVLMSRVPIYRNWRKRYHHSQRRVDYDCVNIILSCHSILLQLICYSSDGDTVAIIVLQPRNLRRSGLQECTDGRRHNGFGTARTFDRRHSSIIATGHQENRQRT